MQVAEGRIAYVGGRGASAGDPSVVRMFVAGSKVAGARVPGRGCLIPRYPQEGRRKKKKKKNDGAFYSKIWKSEKEG